MVYNAYIAIPLATWLIAQLIKFTITAFRGKVDFRYLYASGGMPSVHSAVVCSLATTALLVDGEGSHLFGLAAIFAAIVMYDSFGVRRASGEQAVAINQIVENLKRDRPGLPYPGRLREMFGHKPGEVMAGAALGVVLAGLFNINKLSGLLAYLSDMPLTLERDADLGFFAVLVIVGILVKLLIARKYRKSAALTPIFKAITINLELIGWIGLLFSLAQFERLTYLAWRVWPILLAIIWLAWVFYLVYRHAPTLRPALAAEREEERKRKWLKSGNKHKSKKHKK